MKKIEMKCPATAEPQSFMNKTFKFFDIQNKGTVTADQFKRAITKIGVVVPNDADIDLVFSIYDKSGEGRLDYKRMMQTLGSAHGDQPTVLKTELKTPRQSSQVANQNELAAMIALFRDRIKARGARGMIGLQRIFKIMDDDNSRTLSINEFTKACREFRVGISDEYIPTIFDAFDTNHDGNLNFDEFLNTLRG
jgi:Ca2+-binding EF-hand superfamily protein